MHGSYMIPWLSLGCLRPFSWCLPYFAATHWRMCDGGLAMYPGLACQRVFVPGMIHLCEMAYFDTVEGLEQACLH